MTELEVGRGHHRLPLVGVGEHLEDEPGVVGVEWQEPQLVDHEKARLACLCGLPVEPALVPSAPEAGDERRGGEEARLEPALAGQCVPGRRHTGLAGADAVREDRALAPIVER